MSDTKHTPGPLTAVFWTHEQALDGGAFVIAASNGHGLAKMLTYGRGKKQEANARLFALSPTLLDWLKRRLALDREDNQGTEQWCNAVEGMNIEAEELILKAKGGE